MSASAHNDEVQPVEYVIDRSPSPIDLTQDAVGNVFVTPITNVNTRRRCSFCECSGHTIRNCSHSDIDKLHRCAQFMYLTTCRYLRIHPNTEQTHKKWLDNLTTSEYKILAKLNRLDTNSRTKRNEYQEKLHTYYVEYAVNELRNDRSTNVTSILVMYSANLLQGIVRNEETVRFAINTLDRTIKECGRHLLDMSRFRYWLINDLEYFSPVRQMRYFENPVQPTAKILPTLNDNVELETEVHEECPICYSEMTKETVVQLGCSHSFCGDCIVRQIKSSRKPTTECGLCRSTIKECRSTSKNLLEQMSSKFAN